jgi:hypothetical protein
MGTWGAGNLDSDYALDELAERAHELINEMLLRWQRSDSREYDEYDHTTLFVEFEVVFALAAKGMIPSGRYIPAAATVRTLIADWLAGYDTFMGAEPWPERRKRIVATFEKFVALCETLEGEGALPLPPTKPRSSAKQATPPATAKKPTKKPR